MTYNPNYLDNQLTIAVSGAIDIKLLPHLLPVKFGNAFLLQYILNERGVGDDLHLLPLGFVVGVISAVLSWFFTLLPWATCNAADHFPCCAITTPPKLTE